MPARAPHSAAVDGLEPPIHRVVDGVKSLSAVRRLVEAPVLQPARRALRQSVLVNEPVRYVAASLLKVRGIHRYSMRGQPGEVWLRHPGDSYAFEEIFRARVYELPNAVAKSLPAQPKVLDLGANCGYFTAFMARHHPEAQVTALEPDPSNFEVCRRTLAPELDSGRVRLKPVAGGTYTGTITFAGGLGGSSRVTEGIAQTGGVALSVPLVDVMSTLGATDLAKLDIEGSEWDLLGDSRFGTHGPGAVALEFHPWGAPSGDPRDAASALLEERGYELVDPVRPFAEDEFPAGQGMLWAVRRKIIG